MKKIKVVQIGAMHDHADAIMHCLKKQSDIYELVGYAVPDGETVLREAAFAGVRRMTVEEALSYPGLDAAVIETSERNLSKYALLAATRGLSVHMDKPGGMNLAEFEKLIAVVSEKKLVFHTGYMYRYNTAYQKILADIRDGKYGEIYAVEAHMDCCHPPEKREWLSQFPGGMTFYLGCHLIDLVYRIQGEPEKIIPLNCSTGINGVTARDYGMVVFQYKNGVSFIKTCAAEPGGYMRRQLVVCGSKGTVTLLPFEAFAEPGKSHTQYTGVRDVTADIYNWDNDGEHCRTAPKDRYEGMMRAFCEYVSGEKENPYSYAYEWQLYRLLLKCCGE